MRLTDLLAVEDTRGAVEAYLAEGDLLMLQWTCRGMHGISSRVHDWTTRTPFGQALVDHHFAQCEEMLSMRGVYSAWEYVDYIINLHKISGGLHLCSQFVSDEYVKMLMKPYPRDPNPVAGETFWDLAAAGEIFWSLELGIMGMWDRHAVLSREDSKNILRAFSRVVIS